MARSTRSQVASGAARCVAVVCVALVAWAATGQAWTHCGDCWCAAGNGTCPQWEPTNYSASFVAAFKAQQPLNPYQISCNPYTNTSCVTTPPQHLATSTSAVCGRVYTSATGSTLRGADASCPSTYELVTFANLTAAQNAGAAIMHMHACGLCSTTQDVGTYMAISDMTKVGKECAIEALISEAWGIKCFEKAGFTTPCATIWTYDALYDGHNCRDICIKDLLKPFNGPPPFCPLNACLQCDEDKAGPVFKQYAGATRRRCGLQSNIARPCASVAEIDHVLCP